MMFRTALLSLFLAAAATASPYIPSEGSIPAGSKLGRELLRQATVIEPARFLKDNNNNNNNNQNYIALYDIKYTGCSSLIQINAQGGGGGGGGGQNNNQNSGILYTQHIVKFELCPSGTCSSGCSGGGEYAVSMMNFVDSYTEAKLEEQEYNCEMVRESCYCDNANDDEACEYSCYVNAGMEECIEYEGQEDFEIQRYLECRQMENNNGGNNNNNNNNNNNAQYYYNGNNNGDTYYGSLYIGPYCAADGKSIYLGVFYDSGCTSRADVSLYSKRTYGASLPYSSTSIVKSECLSCKKVENNNNNNNNNKNNNNNNNQNNNNGYYYEQQYETSELCQQAYQQAVKCETDMSVTYKDTTGCEFLDTILPRLTTASRSVSSASRSDNRSGSGAAARAFAWLFAFTTLLFGAYAYFLYRKIKRGSVHLTPGAGAMS